MALSLVTDRVEGAKYNLTDDCNRVENAVLTLQTQLNDAGFNLNLSVRTDWMKTDNPSWSDMERYRSNVAAIRSVLAVFSTTPAVPPSMDKLTFAGANAIEQIILDVETIIGLLEKTWFYSGEIYSGEA